MARSGLTARLGVDLPILLAPMAGGPSTPELVAAVSGAGGLGSVGAAYLSPEQIADACRRIRALTDRPFGLNLFAGGYPASAQVEARAALGVVAEAHARLGLPAPALPAVPPDPFPEQLEAVLETRPALFSFTFGVPAADDLARVRARGILVAGTATTVEEARALADAGVDAIVAQGGEAGGHRGTFCGAFEAALVPTLELTAAIAREVRVPVIASGGLMDGRDVARALAAGAQAAQLGTAFLACPESGASPAYKQALLAARSDTTVVTRAFSGRPARGLANAFIAAAEGRPGAILPYPLQNALTRGMRQAAAKQGQPDYLSLWAGQGVARVRALPAAELVRRLVDEMGT
ncbi:NAD(P)H-dependent flavin oxidoreductase [Anaeromyxobacter oryzae]|uniref:Propionate 3-nitronate monooxygenase n=1 Tax=Anaeromyxobacter oryzae TaxID=2918170 RepID=A0ABM7WP34_9BACT|nr:nitronate monooxygenase [Anaeromyxobacter oryzae]BDG01218.1 oxidoreductase [Anaeromyxobacter oryzae]